MEKLSVFIPKEIKENEARVAATPETVKKIIALGLNVIVEAGAGLKSYISDDEFKSAGANIISKNPCINVDIMLAVNPPAKLKKGKHQVELLKENSVWISFLIPQLETEAIQKMLEKNVTCFSLNLLPRITRAQRMDALSSQSTVAGYKAVILAANELGKMFPLMMTAAGTLRPVKVVVMGGGVAGLQAIATARRLGAQVEATDVRLSVKEQVESLGGVFINVPVEKNMEDKTEYAKEVSKEYLEVQTKEVARHIAMADIVITTALVPGKKAPLLISESIVESMKPGSVIVDLAAEQGGNCALTENGKTVVKHNVKIIGASNLSSAVSTHATEMYAKNIYYFLEGLLKEGNLHINLEDEIYRDSLVTRNRESKYMEVK